MDVSKYHTRYPPPEHEEAVRMLLEGLDKQTSRCDLNSKIANSQDLTRKLRRKQSNQAEQVKLRQRQEPGHIMTKSKVMCSSGKYPNTKTNDNHQASPVASSVDSGSMARGPSEDEYEEDGAYEFPSENRLRNRASATKEDEDIEFNSEESSSREFTIQVSPQISSKRVHVASLPKMQSKATSTASDTISTSGASSSGHNRAANELTERHDDMNGDYEAIPSRTIAIQCDLKLSSVKHDGYLDSASTDLASMQASSISSTRYGFYRLSPETLEQRRELARSVSSRSIAHGGAPPPPGQALNVAEAPTSMSELSSEEEVEEAGGFDREPVKLVRRDTSVGRRSVDKDFEPAAGGRLKRDDRFLSQRQLHQHQDRANASRARRQDSMPRRPKTALSYVSTSRLRERHESTGERTPDKSLSDHEQEILFQRSVPMSNRMTPRSRAMSQQVLSSSQPRQRVLALHNQMDEQMQVSKDQDKVSLSNSDSELQRAEQFRLPQQEEMVVAAKRGRPAMGASPQVRRSNNIRNGPLLRRYATLTATPNSATINKQEINSVHENHLSDREMLAAGQRRQRNNIATNKLSSAGTNYSTTDEENQLEAVTAETRRQRAATLTDQREQPKARFNSMSLARRQPPLTGLVNQTRGSCNIINPTRETFLESAHPGLDKNYHNENQRSTLEVSDRLKNHQTGATPMSNRAQIGRSASMKQGRARLVASGVYEQQAQPVYTTPNLQTNHMQGKNYYQPGGTQCDYEDCCRPLTTGDLDEGYLPNERDLRGPAATTGESESHVTHTWANPSSIRRQANLLDHHHQSVNNLSNEGSVHDYRRPSYPQNVQISAGNRPSTRVSALSHNQIEDSNNQQLIPGIHNRPRRFERIYHVDQKRLDQEDLDDLVGQQQPGPDDEVPSEEVSVCSNSSINGATRDVLTRAQAHHQTLDFDSQQRLNEIGLPEPGHSVAASPSTKRAAASHLGLSAGMSSVANRYATTGRSSQQAGPILITGRAMSQQSLTRPTMPLSRGLRRSGGGGGTNAGSGSDVGGSSMSLISRPRVGSRYENAHTRTPVVMLIPQATSSGKHDNRDLSRSESNSRRASSRLGRPLGKTSGLRVSSQDRASHRRSASRNNSDSESSSSMLRTLVKPRVNRTGTNNKSARRGKPVYGAGNGGHTRDNSDLEENLDGVGQLATEIDSYKFKRRYSVPKDAKINWFSKLKQRVSSKN